MKYNNIKIISRKILLMVFLIIIPATVGIISAQQNNFYLNFDRGDKVVTFTNGQINWSSNQILATASSEISLVDQKNYSYRESIIKKTGEEAREKLFQIVNKIKVDNYRDIRYVIDSNKEIGKKLSMTFKNYSKILEPIFITNTKIEVTAQIPIYGTNSLASSLHELFLLEDETLYDKLTTHESLRNIEYNKLIIDVRGMDYNPSIFPRIFYEKCTTDECIYNISNDKENIDFYIPEIIPIEIREKKQYVRYFKDPYRYKDEIWIKYKTDVANSKKMAYYTSALRIEGENNSDIILHRSDAERFFTKESNIEMLLNGNIYILTD